MRRLLAGLTVIVAAASLTSCGSAAGGYDLTARFPSAIALYEDSDVLVMGVTVGTVTAVTIDDDSILIDMRIDDNVPLPADVTASIVPSSLIGERNVVLAPAWQPGMAKLAPGAAIPMERTIVPIEPDDALKAITDLLQALDPDSVARLFDEGARALDGNGRTINQTLLQLSQLLPYLAEQDDELVAIAGDINALADVVRARDDQIGKLLDDFAIVADTLAAERQQIVGFIEQLASLAREGRALLTAYEVTLPQDLATLAEVSLTVQANAESVQQLVNSFSGFGAGVIDAYDAERHTLDARIFTSRSLSEPLTKLLEALLGGEL